MSKAIRFDPRLPEADRIERWLSEPYLAPGLAHRAFREIDPFEHFILSDLLPAQTFANLSHCVAEEIERVSMCVDRDIRMMRYGPLLLRPAIDFFAGPYLRALLSAIVGRRVRRALGSIPQIRIVSGPAPVLEAHTDEDAPSAMVTFFSTHLEWHSQLGGEISLLHLSDRRCVKRIAPVPNMLYGMFLSSRSLHRVEKINAGWTRSNIFQEWMLD
jgi:hypothetical protein